MSNRRIQFDLDLPVTGRRIDARVSRLLLNNIIIAISIVVAVAMRPAQLADWIA